MQELMALNGTPLGPLADLIAPSEPEWVVWADVGQGQAVKPNFLASA
jgi:hypothetical protein